MTAPNLLTASGLVASIAAIGPYFTANGVTALVDVGWRKRTQGVNQGAGGANRVVFVPSADGGDGGTLGPAKFPGPRAMRLGGPFPAGSGVAPSGTVRELYSWERRCTVSVWAVDTTDRTNETLQIAATEALFEWTARAVHAAPGAFAEAKFGKVKWTAPPERSFGLELVVELTFKQPIFDVPRPLIFPAGGVVARGPHLTPLSYPTDGDT